MVTTADKKRKKLIILTAIPVIAIALVIFIFSAQKAEVSSNESGRITTFIIKIAVPHFEEYDIEKQSSIKHTVEIVVRKLAHFSEFAALGFFVFLHLNLYVQKKPWLISWAASALYACSDEFHQMFVDQRTPKIYDVMIDSAGALCGIGVLALIFLLCKKLKRK